MVRPPGGRRQSVDANQSPPSFVCIGDAEACVGAVVPETESTDGRSMASEPFLRLASAELDRSYRLAGLLLSDRDEAEDAVQDALVRAWGARSSLRDVAGFVPWFDRILVNVCRDRLRRRQRIRFVELQPALDGSARDPFAAFLERDALLGAMESLGSDERVVVILHFWADLTLAEVANRTGWRLGTVKSRLHRALRRIEAGLDTAPEGAVL